MEFKLKVSKAENIEEEFFNENEPNYYIASLYVKNEDIKGIWVTEDKKTMVLLVCAGDFPVMYDEILYDKCRELVGHPIQKSNLR